MLPSFLFLQLEPLKAGGREGGRQAHFQSALSPNPTPPQNPGVKWALIEKPTSEENLFGPKPSLGIGSSEGLFRGPPESGRARLQRIGIWKRLVVGGG